MSPQVIHGLKQAGIMIALAILGVLGSDATGVIHILEEAGVNPLYFGIVTAAIAAAVRWFESLRDAGRASAGKVLPADVGYSYIKEQAEVTPPYEMPVMAENNRDVLV
jgi:hypothetical protein